MQITAKTLRLEKLNAYLASRAESRRIVKEGLSYTAEKATDGATTATGHLKKKYFVKSGSALEGIFGRASDLVMFVMDEVARVTNNVQQSLSTSDTSIAALGFAATPHSLDSLRDTFHVAENFVSDDTIATLERLDTQNTVAKRTFEDVLDGEFIGPLPKAFNDALLQADTPAERVSVANDFVLEGIFTPGIHKIDGAFAVSAERMTSLRGTFGIENGSNSIYVFSPRQTVITPQPEISAQTNQPAPVHAPAPGLFSGR